MEIKSVQKYVITSPKKIREVVSMIKSLSPFEAYERLPFSGKRAGKVLRKVIGTAIANAMQKEISEDKLFFKEIQITDGPILRRWRAGARGMAKPYKRRMSHIRVVLGVREAERQTKTPNKKRGNTEGTEITENTEKKRGVGRLIGKGNKNKTEKDEKTKNAENKNRKGKKA